MHVLFVCSGNTCRSPMAEGYLRHLLASAKAGDVTVSSAGTHAADGFPASDNSVEVMDSIGIDISMHRSRRLTVELLKEADLVVVMTSSHRRHVGSMLPEALHKTRLLSEYAREDDEIHDPFGGTVEDYGFCFADMRKPLENLLEVITGSSPG